MALKDPIQDYIELVEQGGLLVSEYTWKALERHRNDLKRIGDPDFPYAYKPPQKETALRPSRYLNDALSGDWALSWRQHPDNAKHPMQEPARSPALWCFRTERFGNCRFDDEFHYRDGGLRNQFRSGERIDDCQRYGGDKRKPYLFTLSFH